MKKVLIISTSLRKGSNYEILAHEFERGAKDVGNEVEILSLSDKTVGYCIGCLSCQKHRNVSLKTTLWKSLKKSKTPMFSFSPLPFIITA